MMATTHALWGMVIALPIAVAAPEYAPVALLAGFFGGLAPDFDLYTGHRRTLHYPVYGWAAVAPALALAVVAPTPVTIAIAVGVTAAALHALSDILGSGLEVRPWQAGTDRAVYSHYHGRWLRARRVIRYDGAPEDLALAAVGAFALVALVDHPVGPVDGPALVLAMLAVSSIYTLLRKPLAGAAERLALLVPPTLLPYVPARYLDPTVSHSFDRVTAGSDVDPPATGHDARSD